VDKTVEVPVAYAPRKADRRSATSAGSSASAGPRSHLEAPRRLYRLDGLQLRMRVRRRKPPTPTPAGPREAWKMDFAHVAFPDKRRFRVLTVGDQWSRESPLREAATPVSGRAEAEALDQHPVRVGDPALHHARSRHGVHLTSAQGLGGASGRVALDFIHPRQTGAELNAHIASSAILRTSARVSPSSRIGATRRPQVGAESPAGRANEAARTSPRWDSCGRQPRGAVRALALDDRSPPSARGTGVCTPAHDGSAPARASSSRSGDRHELGTDDLCASSLSSSFLLPLNESLHPISTIRKCANPLLVAPAFRFCALVRQE
jgi:hypothetical protein